MSLVDLPLPPDEWRSTPHRAAVLGSPIDHSLSPVLHNAAYKALGIPWTYDRREVLVPDLAAMLADASDLDVGFSVTMPLKAEALRLADDATERAVRSGGANTLVRRPQGWLADNTDIAGLVAAIRSELVPDAAVNTLTVLGSGATARSVALAAAALGVEHLTICARREEAARAVADLAELKGVTVDVVGWEHASAHLTSAVVVSTVVAHAADSLAAAVPAVPGVFLDVVYAPWPSALAAAWQERGGAVIPGTRMLLHQAAVQVHLMTGVPAPVHRMREALESVGAPV
jgi:shikimate dehydrogenase